VDVSPNMVATYNARARAADFSSSQITAVVGDMLSKGQPLDQEIAGLEFYNFDLAAVGFAFHHFEDVLYAAERLQERLKPGGVLVFSDFVQGADLLVDESGNPIEGSEGDHAAHDHGHHHHHGEHNHGHGHANEQRHHQNHHGHPTKGDTEPRQPLEDPLKDPETHTKMRKSIVFENFTVDGVKEFLTAAGFVDVDAVVMEDRVYMEFAGKKMWRKILFGKGRRPLEGKSEL
jgi:SAM-dependent methyltransferase